MKFAFWKHWRIAPQIGLIAILPALLMFISVVIYSYYSRSREAVLEIQEQGRLNASVIAEMCEYAVASGDLTYLTPTIKKLLTTNPSILRVQVVDVDGRTLLDLGTSASSNSTVQLFTAPIVRQPTVVSDLGTSSAVHYPATGSTAASTPLTLGRVQIVATSEILLARHKQRIAVGSAIAALALLVSSLFGYWLARGITRPLTATIQDVRRIRGGNYETKIALPATGEVGELQQAISEMAASVSESKRDLESKVETRTLDLAKARDRAVKSDAEVRRLLDRIQAVVEEERSFITSELHDHLNAELIVISLETQQILALANKGSDPDKLRAHAASIRTRVDALYKTARSLVQRLRPEILGTMGLQGALEEIVKTYDDMLSGCAFHLDYDGAFSNLGDALALAAYRIVQEALSNIVRHSKATLASVRLLCDDETVTIRIEDNGSGFDAEEVTAGVGLIGMRQRVQSLSGSLIIHSAPGLGTQIDIRLPLSSDDN